jgi:hypothetical protein
MSREELESLDLIEFNNCVKVAISGGMPESLVKDIWKKSADEDYVEMYKRWKMKGAANGL